MEHLHKNGTIVTDTNNIQNDTIVPSLADITNETDACSISSTGSPSGLTINTHDIDIIDRESFNPNQILKVAASHAKVTMKLGIGGPFGAAVVKDNCVVAVASNTVLRDEDPTAHAEVNAIREACKLLKTHDLTGCELYATSMPCPMCLSAIIWSNIKKVYVSGLEDDASEAGFRDQFIYDYIREKLEFSDSVLKIERMDRSIAQDLFKEYKEANGQIY